MIAVVVVRDGALPLGADEVAAECAGRAVIVGSGTATAAVELAPFLVAVETIETTTTGAAALTAALVPILDRLDAGAVVLPASADGRDLAPRLAAALRRTLYANATLVTTTRVELLRAGGLRMQRVTPTPRFVATLVPGVRGAVPVNRSGEVQRLALGEADSPTHWTAPPPTTALGGGADEDTLTVAVLPPQSSTMDLAEAPRILGGGAGLDSAVRFEQLAELGTAIDASVGATRVITDRHWISHDRQIGSTGVVVDPDLYIAFGISGAVQHTAGLGHPAHIISVNTDPHCPMMQLADLAVVADANTVLDALLIHLADDGGSDD